MSSDPPPMLSSGFTGCPISASFVAIPGCVALPSSFCSALASVWSASLHSGKPTFWMLAYIVSAIGLLKCCG